MFEKDKYSIQPLNFTLEKMSMYILYAFVRIYPTIYHVYPPYDSKEGRKQFDPRKTACRGMNILYIIRADISAGQPAVFVESHVERKSPLCIDVGTHTQAYTENTSKKNSLISYVNQVLYRCTRYSLPFRIIQAKKTCPPVPSLLRILRDSKNMDVGV